MNIHFEGWAIYQNVIDVSDHKSSQNVPQHMVYQALKHRGGAREPIWHYSVFEVTTKAAKRCLPFVTLTYVHQVLGTTKVELGEKSG